MALAPAFRGAAGRLRSLLRRGPAPGITEPCAERAAARPAAETAALIRAQGRMRLAERVWRASRLVAQRGWAGAWEALLEGALASSAGRWRESANQRAVLAQAVTAGLAPGPVERSLARLAGDQRALCAALRGGGAIGVARARELGWNAALPLLAALAVAYGDRALGRRTALLADRWPAPRPYGRTRTLDGLLGA